MSFFKRTCTESPKGMHNFEARYEDAVVNITLNNSSLHPGGGSLQDLLPAPRKIYLRDICVRCGKVIERAPEAK